jgi:hypothetical protein
MDLDIAMMGRGIDSGGQAGPTADGGAPQSRWSLLCKGGGGRPLRRAIILAAWGARGPMFAIRRKRQLWATLPIIKVRP